MKKITKNILLCICVLCVFVSCKNTSNSTSKPDISVWPQNSNQITPTGQTSQAPDIASSAPVQTYVPIGPDDSGIGVFVPTFKNINEYKIWEKYFKEKYNIAVSVYTKNETNASLFESNYLGFDIDSTSARYLPMELIRWESNKIDRYGIYLINSWAYYTYYQRTLNYINKHPNRDTWKIFGPELWKPLNEYDICKNLSKELLKPYTDNEGNIWALPYEYKYPSVRVRKYNSSIMRKLGKETPITIFELYNLLITVKKETDIPNVLPTMKRGAVFSGFEDIVNAFGIKTSADQNLESFYSIQYDEETEKYTDIAFSEKMKQCIDFFTLLIDSELIDLDIGSHISNELFFSGAVFSIYDNINREEDLSTPFSSKLYAYDYEPYFYFLPSKYVYVLGRDQEFSQDINGLFDAFYLSYATKLSARYGIENSDYFINDGELRLSKEGFEKAPKLIGEFPNDKYILKNDDELQKLRDEIEFDNIESGYYRELSPISYALEAKYNIGKTSKYWVERYSGYKASIFAYTFYSMLSDYFFDENRPSVEEFLESYRLEMKKQITSSPLDNVKLNFYKGAVIEMDFEY